MPPDELNNLEPILEAQTLQNEEIKANGEETNALLQALIASQENDNDALIEAQIENDNQNTEKVVGAIKELKPTLEKSASSTDRMVNFLEQMKGEKGDKGDKGDTGERGEKGDKGDKGEQGIEGEKGEKGDKGDKGDTGKNGKDGKNGLDGSDGKDGKDGKKGKDGSPDTGEEIVAKLSKLKGEKRLDKSAIKGLDKMQKELDHVASFGSHGQEYRIGGTKVSANSSTLNFIAGANTTITGQETADGANITITSTGGGGGGSVDSVVAGHGTDVDATDPANPIVAVDETELTHNSLGGLQGGTAGQYNHLTDAQITQLHAPVTVSDTSEIDLTLTGQQISASIVSGSIDETKLDASVNASLDLADTAVQPADLAPYELLANKSTSTSLGTSDTLYPTQNAVKTYADNLVVGLLDYRGAYDASGNVFPSSGGSGTAGAVLKGDLWIIDTAGTLGGSAVQIGDSVIANVDTPGQTAGNWNILNGNISYVPENVANKVTSLSGASTDTEYPSAKLTYDQLALKVTANAGITGATKTKITYDAKGLVTAGADATTADIADSTNKRYVTDADLTDIGNLSGTNTGDQTITNSSDATSHTVTLSASGGSVQLIEGSGITLTTGGTASAGTVTIAASGGSGATTALDNLASVAINTSLVSDTDETDDLGTTLKKWANLFVTTIGATATRVTKGWFTDIESTNMPTVGGTPILSSLTAPQFTTVELGHASDTTLSRVSAGVVAVEGKTLANLTDGGTFAADISVPDEAYGSGWNGSVEVPTKNAIYDKIETLSSPSITTILPRPMFPTLDDTVSNSTLSTNTTIRTGMFNLPQSITVNQIALRVQTVTSAGTVNIAIFSEDGQTREINVTSGTISGTGINTISVSSVTLSAGNHYFLIQPVSTTNIVIDAYQDNIMNSVWNNVSSQPIYAGDLTGTASTMVSTFNPTSDITPGTSRLAVFRLDN